MTRRSILALSGACLTLAAMPAGALAAGTSVSVRVEGIKHTLLPQTTVKTHRGSITKGGAPAGACPATTAAGALDVATKHKWNGSYGKYGLSVTSVFGESHPLSSKDYWSIWVNNKYAPAGICGLKLHKGEQLLFAAVPDKGTEYPIVLTVPTHSTATQAFTVTAFYFSGSKRTPLADVHLSGLNISTGVNGTAVVAPSVTPGHRKATFEIVGSKKGFIRSATATLTVTAAS